MIRCAYLALAVLLALAIACPALAADTAETCWISRDDPCYHLDAGCGDPEGGRYPISEAAALEFEKTPCPVCVAPEATPEPEAGPALRATERGGTWVFRIPAEQLAAVELASPEPDATDDPLVSAFAATVSDLVSLRLAVPEDGALFMNLRVIDGSCFLVLRPERAYSEEKPLIWRAESMSLNFFGDEALTLDGVSRPIASAPEQDDGDRAQVFSQDYDGLDISVYRAMDTNIAVLHQSNPEADALDGMLQIGSPSIPVRGYRSGKQAIYCCVITDAELGALVGGAKPEIRAAADDAGGEAETVSSDNPPNGETDDSPSTDDGAHDEAAGEKQAEGN